MKESFRTVTEEYLMTSLSIMIDPITSIGTDNTLITVRTLAANSKGAFTKYWAIRGCNSCNDVSECFSILTFDKMLLTVNINEIP